MEDHIPRSTQRGPVRGSFLQPGTAAQPRQYSPRLRPPTGQVAGIDIGGTFTDVFLVDESTGAAVLVKTPTTSDQSGGVLRALSSVDTSWDSLRLIAHGTTIATNAVIERTGAQCGLITTAGFRDVLELGRRDRPQLYGLRSTFEPLIPRWMRKEVDERIAWNGSVERQMKAEDVLRATRELLNMGAESLAISFPHSYANPSHEKEAEEVIRRVWPNDFVTASTSIVPDLHEFERTSTVAVNAYVQPLISRYLERLQGALQEAGFNGLILVVRSNGGLMQLEEACRHSVHTIRSGPAAGVIAAAQYGAKAGFPNLISCDMGGTSLDVAIVASGRWHVAHESLIDYRTPLQVPMVEVDTLGAGGGSIAWIDRGGVLQVGPRSAGASPGPAAYGRGGHLATVTDANVVLGRIAPDGGIASALGSELDVDAAVAAVETHIARPLGIAITAAAAAVLDVVTNNMAGRIRLLTVDKGYDPRDFCLVAFGGAGPLHAALIMRAIGVKTGLIPPHPGVSSAIGCTAADLAFNYMTVVDEPLERLSLIEGARWINEQITLGVALATNTQAPIVGVTSIVEADLHYAGQRHSLTIRLPWPRLRRADLARSFLDAYSARFGRTLRTAVVVRALRVTVIGERPRMTIKAYPESNERKAMERIRAVWFDGGVRGTTIVRRSELLTGAVVDGPALIEQPDTTSLVLPRMSARLDGYGNLVVTDA